MTKITKTLTDFVRPSEHSIYSPSSMDRLIGCPASVKICNKIPQEASSSYAAEGTLAHELAEQTFYQDMFGIELTSDLLLRVNDYSSREDMFDGAKMYSHTVQDFLQNQTAIGDVIWYGLEKGIPIFPEDLAFGTGDCTIVGTHGAVIIDYKFGSKKVNPDALQLKAYAAGVAKHLLELPEDYKVICVIVQPRVSGYAESHEYNLKELTDFTDEMATMIKETKKEGLDPIEGNHCFWCPASRTKDPLLKCPAKRDKAFKVLENDFKSLLSDVSSSVENFTTKNEKRDEALKKVIALKDLVDSVAAQALEEFEFRLAKGEEISGVEMVSSEGNRAWKHKGVEMFKELKESFPEMEKSLMIEVPATSKLITIGQFEKLAGKGAADVFTVKPITKKISLKEEVSSDLKLAFMGYI